MTRLLRYLDRAIDVGLIFVLVFTPLAFGGVEEWARAIGQLAIIILFAAWLLRLVWAPVTQRAAAQKGAILGGRVRLSGLELPALLFAVVVLFQLIPLPPSVVRAVSPRTGEIFEQSLPGYGEAGQPSFQELPRWLQSDSQAEAGGIPALPPDPDRAVQAIPAGAFDVQHQAWRPLSITPGHTRRALEVFLAHLAFFVVAFNHLGPVTRFRRYLYVLAGLAGVMSVLGIVQSLSADQKLYWWRGSGPNSSFGPFVNANNFAGWMEMVLPVAAGLALMLWARQRRSATLSGSMVEQISGSVARVSLLGFTTIVSLVAFLLAKSRGGLLALLGAAAIFVLFNLALGRLRWKRAAAAVLTIALALAMAAWIDRAGLWERYRTLGDVRQERSFQERMDFAKQTLEMAVDFPVLGTGFGTFQEAFYLYSPGTSDKRLARTHNDYAQLVSECGLLGAVAMLWALAILLARGVIRGLLRRGRSFQWPVQGAALGVLALLLHSIVGFNLQIYSNGLLFVFLCAVLMRDHLDDRPRVGAGQ